MTNYQQVMIIIDRLNGLKSLFIYAGINTEWIDYKISTCYYMLGWTGGVKNGL